MGVGDGEEDTGVDAEDFDARLAKELSANGFKDAAAAVGVGEYPLVDLVEEAATSDKRRSLQR